MDKTLRTSPFHFVLWGIIAIILIRLVLVFTMGMMPQDAYYYLYSEHLSLSYFDHPPMVAWMLKLFSFLFGKTVMGVKLTDFIITGGTIFVFYKLARHFFEGFMLHRSVYLLLSTMMISILSLVTTPDVPLLLFWSLSLLFMYRAIDQNQVKDWLLAGLLTGLAFDSKYTAVMLWVGLAGFLITYPEKRTVLRTFKPYLALFIFILTISPVIIWNIQHDWISIRFQSSDRVDDMNAMSIQLKYFFGNIGTQIFILLPALYFFVLLAIWKGIRHLFVSGFHSDYKRWFLWWFSAPLILGFILLSLIYWVKLNWTMPAYISGILLAVYIIPRKWVRIQIILSLIFHFAFLIQVFYYPFSIKSDDTWWGWTELARKVEERHELYPDAFIFSDDGYKTSAQLSFHMDQKIYAGNILGKNGLQFSVIDSDLSTLKGGNAIYLDSDKRFSSTGMSDKPIPDLEVHFNSVKQLEPIILYNQAGEPERKFLVYFLQGYKGP